MRFLALFSTLCVFGMGSLSAQTASDTVIAARVLVVADSVPCVQWWVTARQERACDRLDSVRTALLTVGRVTDHAVYLPLTVARDSIQCWRPPWLRRLRNACIRLDSIRTAMLAEAVATIETPTLTWTTRTVWPHGLGQLDTASAGNLVCVVADSAGLRFVGYPAMYVRRAPLRTDSVVASASSDTGAVLQAACQGTLGGVLQSTHRAVDWSWIRTPVLAAGTAMWIPVAKRDVP